MIVKIDMMWKGEAMVSFKVVSQHLPQEAQKRTLPKYKPPFSVSGYLIKHQTVRWSLLPVAVWVCNV
jgi:hypothetical protein